MKSYDIVKVKEGFNWDDIEKINMEVRYKNSPEEVKSYAQICYDDEKILLHLETEDKDFRKEETGPLGQPYEDSCLEFFFSPMEGDLRYFNFEYNYNKCLLLGFRENLHDAERLILKDDKMLGTVTNKTEKGWEIYYGIPFKFIQRYFPDFKAEAGKRIRANCFTCSESSEPQRLLSWSEVKGEPFTFHKPECFGVMTFR